MFKLFLSTLNNSQPKQCYTLFNIQVMFSHIGDMRTHKNAGTQIHTYKHRKTWTCLRVGIHTHTVTSKHNQMHIRVECIPIKHFVTYTISHEDLPDKRVRAYSLRSYKKQTEMSFKSERPRIKSSYIFNIAFLDIIRKVKYLWIKKFRM